jgi:hypothetical protein
MKPKSPYQETRAVARLPHLDVKIQHRRPWEGEGEQIVITLQATPSFEAFGEFLESTNPWLLWMGLMRAAWEPGLGGLAAATSALQVLAPPKER